MKKPLSSQNSRFLLHSLILLAVLFSALSQPQAAHAAAALTVTPISWNVIGLDSNNVTVGPNHFPIGARACNTGDSAASNVTATFVWDTTSPYINIRPGTYTTLPTVSNLNPGACTDFYFEIEVTRNAAAYDQFARYHIAVSADGGATTGSTPTPRELYVERLISQSRNSVTDMQLSSTSGTAGFTSIPAGGTMALVVGNTYWIKMVGTTATNGYEQIESFINIPNTIFQVKSVATTYSAGTTPTTKLYGDACTWENDPNSPNYRSCLGVGKQGGATDVVYEVTVLSVPAAPLSNPATLGTLIYDFSGSSYHYNGDFGTSSRIVAIIDPLQAGITKTFSPSTISIDGVSRLTISIHNTNPAAVSGYNFTDPLPTNMRVATPPNASTTSCGTPTFTPAADAASLSFSNGTVAANGTCTIQVDVTASAVASYTNTTDHLFVDSQDTTKYASGVLSVTAGSAAPAPTCNIELATWDMGTGSGTAPPAFTFQSASVSSATAAYAGTGTQSIDSTATTGGSPNYWKVLSGWAANATGYPNAGASPYYEFSLDTSAFTNVTIEFDYYLGGNWATASNNEMYVYSSADGGAFTNNYTTTTLNTSISRNTWYSSPAIKASSTGSNTTAFRVNFVGQQQNTAYTELDNVKIFGCRVLDPAAITKAFSPNPVAVGSTSTLTLTVANPNQSPSATLTGINFDDFLPSANLQGAVAVTNGSATITGTGTAFRSQLAANSILSFSSTPESLQGTVAVTSGSAAVTGTGTAFSTQLAVGSILVINAQRYVVSDIISNTSLRLTNSYAGATASGLSASRYVSYTVSSITSDTVLTLTSAYTGSTQSGLTLAAGLTLASAPTTTCSGTATGGVGGSAISLSGNRLNGTVGVTNGSATVTGTGTAFSTQLQVGSRIAINGVNVRVSAIASNTSLTLSSTYSGTTASGLIYTYGDPLQGTISVSMGSAAVTGSGTAFQTQLVAGDIIYIGRKRYTVSTITSNTALTLTTSFTENSVSNEPYYPDRTLRGTVAVTNGSAAVTGTSTFFTSELAASTVIYINGVKYSILSISDATHLTLATNYAGTTSSGLRYSREDKSGLAGGGSAACSVTATVRANASGVHANVSENVSAAESGTNITSTGYASANLNAILPPQISKQFSTNPILSSGASTLTFTITNPNQNDTLSGIAFSDTYPSGLTNTNPAVTTGTTCSGTLTAANGSGSVSLSGGSLAGGASCIVNVRVTATTTSGNLSGTVAVTNGSATVTGTGTAFDTQLAVGRTIYINTQRYIVASIASATSMTLTTHYSGATESGLTLPGGYFNVSGNVSSIINGSTVIGNTASDTLTVNAVHPAIAIRKQVGASPSGPWYDTLAVPADQNIYYKFTVENSGDVPLSAFNVTDPTLVPTGGNLITCAWETANSPSTLPGLPLGTATVDPSASCVVGPVTAVTGSHPNTATAHGTYNSISYASTPDTATYQTKSLSIVKSVAENYYAAVGNVLHYSYLVTNSGYASLLGPVTVTDDKVSVTCPAVTSVGDGDTWFDMGEALVCSATYTIVAGDIGTGNQVTNTAYATADGINSAISIQTVPFQVLDLTVTNTNSTSGDLVKLGESFTWTLTMSAAGDIGAVFQTGQVIVSEPLPAGPTYGSPTPGSFTAITNSGNIVCAIAASTLTCTASGGPVTIGAGGSFSAVFTVTPDIIGTLSATATIDPGSRVTESNESNNTASNSVTVVAIDAVDDTGVSVVWRDGGTAVENVLVNDTLNGGQATLGNVTITRIGTWPDGITLDTGTGAVSVAPQTFPAIYTPQYQICATDYPSICDTATVTLDLIDPTAVNILSFTAVRTGSTSAVLSWETANETDTVGFNLFRRVGQDGAEVKLNQFIIPADYLGGVTGGSYSFTDGNVPVGAVYYYRLECLDTNFQLYDFVFTVLGSFLTYLPYLAH